MAKPIGKGPAWYCAILAALLIAAVFCGCTGGGMDKKASNQTLLTEDEAPGTWEGLSAETERQIRQGLVDYYTTNVGPHGYTIDNFPIDYYFGTYHGYVVIAFLGDATVICQIAVADIVFTFPLAATMLAWEQGEKPGGGRFYDVREAYDLGLLTTDDVKNIYDMYRKHALNRGDNDDGFVEEKKYSNATLEDNFADDKVVIILTKAETFKFKTYTPEDFPEIDCLLVTDSTAYAMEIVKQQLEAEKTGDWSKLQKLIEMGMLMDVNSFRRIIDLHLAEKSKENVLKAIKLLEKREDILYAGPDYKMYITGFRVHEE